MDKPKPATVEEALDELHIELISLIEALNRLMLCTGPPGIGKTALIGRELLALDKEFKAAWDALSDKAKLTHPRSQFWGEHPRYRPIYRRMPSTLSFRKAYELLYYNSSLGEITWFDDVGSLRDPDIQQLIMQATDPETGGAFGYGKQIEIQNMVLCDGSIIPVEAHMMGGIIVTHNLRNMTDSRLKAFFSEAFMSRAKGKIYFPWEPQPLFNYVFKTGFGVRTLQFITNPTRKHMHYMKLRYDSSKEGLGFGRDRNGNPTMDANEIEQQAKAMMREVRDYYIDRRERVTEHSHRTIQEILQVRITHKDWKRVYDRRLSVTPTPIKYNPPLKLVKGA